MKILPGFMMLSGSSARLIARMTSSAVADARPRDSPSCPGRRRARRCRCRPWRWRALDQPVEKCLRRGHLVGVVAVDQHGDMEIAVADMADDRRRSGRCASMSSLRLDDAFGEPRDRHADVGGAARRARAQRRARPNRRRAAPATAACAPPACRPSRNAAAVDSRAISPKRLDLLGDAASAAVELDEQRRRLRQVELGIGVEGADLQCVEQLDARHRNAELDRCDDGVAGAVERRERADRRGEIASGMPCSRSVSSVMMPSVPSEPTSSRVRS